MTVGIDAIDFYIPQIALQIGSLAEAREIPTAKLEKGLGLKSIALADIDEDAASMAANALYQLLINNSIDPKKLEEYILGLKVPWILLNQPQPMQ